MDEVLQRLAEFHGHLGPFVVVGYRMGEFALARLGARKYFGLSVESLAGLTPPLSCMNDGLQLSTGCTVGKGNIRVREEGRLAAVFRNHAGALRVSLREEAVQRISAWLAAGEEQAAAQVLAEPAEALFDWELDC